MRRNERKLAKRYLQSIAKLLVHLFQYRMKRSARRAFEITKLFETCGRRRWSKHVRRLCSRRPCASYR